MIMSSEKNRITKADLKKIFWRSVPTEHSWNYERQSNCSYCFALLPILKKLYPDKKDLSESMKRHMEFFNTTPYVVTFPLAISAAMEEKRAENPDNFDTASIVNVKTALMGPMAAIGDTLFHGTLRIVATGIGTTLALQGNPLGALLFLLIFNIPAWAIRYIMTFKGYEIGTGFLEKVQKSGIMETFTFLASIIGLMVTGAMSAGSIGLALNINFGTGDAVTSVQSLIDGIVPRLLPLVLFGIVWKLLKKKKVSPLVMMLAMIVIGIIGAYFNIWG
ncbi:MAG: PTS system mannose/fructose/sorbose family transporter subunit IID [Anaerosacchariphilus sp.]